MNDRMRGLVNRLLPSLRRIGKGPRALLRHASTGPTAGAARRALERVASRLQLSLSALPGRRPRNAAWSKLVADVAALGASPESARTVSIVVIGSGRGSETAAARAARVAREADSDRLCFVSTSTTFLRPDYAARLAAAIDGTNGAVAAAPLVVHPLRRAWLATPHDGRVRARGLELDVASEAPVVRARDAGTIATLGEVVRVAGASAACLLVDRAAYTAAGGLPDLADIDLAMFELCRNLRARGGAIVVVSDAVAVDHRTIGGRTALTTPIATGTAAWRSYVENHGPALMREAQPRPASVLRIALTVAAPSAKVASRWGDWHLADAFARALRQNGHIVRVQTIDHADDLASRSCDVHCVVRGLQPVSRSPGQVHALWIISHPESVTTAECDAADIVFVASTRFAEALRLRTRTPVEVLLQATDANRFRPRPPDPQHAHDVAVVAKSRNVLRASVADALAAGLQPAIYGSGWENFVDPALVVSQYVANEELPIVYSSVGVLLNDHWQSMREWGFVSNRLFDALACGTPVISDELPELAELFAGAVMTYRDPDELRALVAKTLADRAAARTVAGRGRELVREHHTFEQRAEEFLAALRRHGLV